MTVGKSDPNYNATLNALRGSGIEPVGGDLRPPRQTAGRADQGSRRSARSELLGEDRNRRNQARSGHRQELVEGEEELVNGNQELSKGSGELAEGAETLSAETRKLNNGLGRLGAGAARLATGIAELGEGATSLQVGLGDAFSRSHPLETGLRRGAVRVTVNADQAREQTDQLRHQSPGIFDSGYFVLSALDGAQSAPAPPGHARRSTSTKAARRRR